MIGVNKGNTRSLDESPGFAMVAKLLVSDLPVPAEDLETCLLVFLSLTPTVF